MAWTDHLRRSIRHPGGDFNLYGLDPQGRKAHLAKHMYGPWQPPTIALVRFSGKSQAPPRYGPPSSEQSAWLPRIFIQRDPPSYHGKPSPPYLPPPPLGLDWDVFNRLVSRPRKNLDQGAIQPLALIAHGGECSTFLNADECYSRIVVLVWSLPIVYMTSINGPTYQFHVSTATPWTDFKHVASTYLQLRHLGGRLGYRIHQNGGLGELRALRHSIDWEGAMRRFSQAAERNISGELVVFNVSVQEYRQGLTLIHHRLA